MNKLINTIRRRYREHFSAWRVSDREARRIWIAPSLGRLKCNFDVAITSYSSTLAVGFRDHSSSLCMLYVEHVQSRDPFKGETMGAVRAANLARRAGWHQVDFESDCLNLCNQITQNPTTQPCFLETLHAYLRGFLSTNPSCSLQWIPRRRNQFAHLLAKWASSRNYFGFIPISALSSSIALCEAGCF